MVQKCRCSHRFYETADPVHLDHINIYYLLKLDSSIDRLVLSKEFHGGMFMEYSRSWGIVSTIEVLKLYVYNMITSLTPITWNQTVG